MNVTHGMNDGGIQQSDSENVVWCIKHGAEWAAVGSSLNGTIVVKG